MDDLVLGFSLIVCVLVTGVFSFVQEQKESEMRQEFDKLLPEKALVIRDGEELLIDASDIVLGDVVVINAGDQIPADIRIFEATNFKVEMKYIIIIIIIIINIVIIINIIIIIKVDNSTLTGESEPQWRSAECTHDNALMTDNLVFYSTFCVEGYAKVYK